MLAIVTDGEEREGAGAPAAGGGPRWAADEPTAMWDEDALRREGLDPALAPERPAATKPDVRGPEPAKVEAGAGAASGAPTAGLSWLATFTLAALVAAVVYVVVRMLR